MKYDDFKIFKFSTITKIFDYKRYNFLRFYKNINFRRYKYISIGITDFAIFTIKHIFSGIDKSFKFIKHHSFKIYRNIDFKKYNFFRIYRYSELKRYNLSRIYRYLDFRRYNFSRIYRYLNIKKYKYVPAYVVCAVVFAAFIYLNIPMFFNYDKSKLENTICKNLNIKCSIQGKINYSFYPSPRIKIKDLIIQDFVDKKKTLGKIENAVIKLSFYNLSNKSKLNFVKIDLQNAKNNFELH